MADWHTFMETFSFKDYVQDGKGAEATGEDLTHLKALVEQYTSQGYEIMSLKTLGTIEYYISGNKRPVILHVARCYAYYTPDGEVYASCISIPAKSLGCTDANCREVYAAPTENGDEIQFVKTHISGSPSRLDSWVFESPSW